MKVTIAIPFFNDGRYLKLAIQSVLNQTFTDYELILINDGSTDDSMEIAEQFAQKDNRIKIVNDGLNLGLASRLNQTIKMAQGEYYARMDADDIMFYKRIEIQVNWLDSHKDIDVLGSSVMLINATNEIVGSHDVTGIDTNFIHPSIMGRIAWFRCNPYAEWCKRSQDRELWLRTANKSKFYNLSMPLLFYREAGTVTFDKYKKTLRSRKLIFSHYKDYKKTIFWYMKYMIKNCISYIVYYLYDKCGKLDCLVKKRKRRPLSNDLCLTNNELIKSYTELIFKNQ